MGLPGQEKMTSHSTNHRIGVLESEIRAMLESVALNGDIYQRYFYNQLLDYFDEYSTLYEKDIEGLERRIKELHMEIVFKDA